MATREFYASLPRDERLKRLARTPDDLATAIAGRGAAELAQRPDPKNWSPVEIICHLRDIEEICMMRFRTMLAMDDPKVLVVGARPPDPAEWGLVGDEFPVDPDRWAHERQYARCDPTLALTAFRRRRGESLDLFDRLSGGQWERGCLHPTLGRVTFIDWTALMPGHDDNHLDQLARALTGRA
jgi:DinB family protein